MRYVVTIEDPENGFEDDFYEETEDEAFDRGLDEIMLCDGEYATFTIYDSEEDCCIGTYNRDGEEV